jgi:phosphatidylserine/phosphatidylglycerophosphate/cardiolipin synthase-like enzyme
MAFRDALLTVDRTVGDGAERLVRRHHERRLRSLGWERALDPPGDGLWAAGDPPPRAGCALEVLIDGEEALARIADELRRAESHVHLAGWFFTPSFRLGHDVVLRELLAELAERVAVRVLAWAGAPLPLFHPSRGEVRKMRDELIRGTRIECALDDRERPMHCHHEKLVIVDDRVAFVGGIDLTTLGGDRLDSRGHPARGSLGWHDATTRLEGPVVADVADHFRLRWREVTGAALPTAEPPMPAGELTVQTLRTVPEKIYRALPRGEFRILESYVRALRSAEKLVYLESQFLWSPELVAILARKLRRPPTEDFRLVVLLPAKPKSGADETRGQLGVLAEADGGAGRLLACTLYQRGDDGRVRPVYVHAKIGIVDDRWLTIGSANLNEHSLFNDTEFNVVCCDPDLVRETRLRLWSEHLDRPVDELGGDPVRVVDELWRPLAEEQLARREASAPLTHKLLRLPHVSRRTRRLLGPLQGFFVDG